MAELILPGRLGSPEMTLLNDPRTDPRVVAVLEMVGGLADNLDPIGLDASYEDCLAYVQGFEDTAAAANPAMMAAMPTFEGIESTQHVIKGVDGNDITLFIDQPKQRSGDLPCLVHTHGGGMVMMSAEDPGFLRLRMSLASLDMVVVGVEFRNGGGRLGNHPFPAGLNDCASAVQWVHANRAELGVSKIVVSGESGGGNLSLATALKANREGWVNQIDGVFGMCPYISGSYAAPPDALLSLRENDGYMLDCAMMAAIAKVYDPTGEHASNPLAWPLYANPEDMKGLPPHVISVNELDPLRDEGLAYFRKLLAAGVPAVGRTSHGTTHAGDQGYPDQLPEVYWDLVRAIRGFAASV